MISFVEASAAFEYNPVTGLLAAKSCRGKIKTGQVLGTDTWNGYLKVGFKYTEYKVHQIVWLLCTGIFPDKHIDHINGNGKDNRICNLRLATVSQNLANRSHTKRSTTKIKGVYWDKARGKWKVQITVRYKQINIGRFDTIAEAQAAYNAKAVELFGEFARS